jgi:hypothetical protein
VVREPEVTGAARARDEGRWLEVREELTGVERLLRVAAPAVVRRAGRRPGRMSKEALG